jgi:hypothetical protein
MPLSMKSSLVIRVINFVNGEHCPIAGQYLMSFDFDAFEGQGFGTFTDRISEARRFEDMTAALEFWRTQSTVLPLRPDGKPNRPFTCTTIELIPVKE